MILRSRNGSSFHLSKVPTFAAPAFMRRLRFAAVAALLCSAMLLCGTLKNLSAVSRPPRRGRPRAPASYNAVVTSRLVVALTFDDGPHPEFTPKLLDILRDSGVRATFYVVGRNVEAYPEIARRIVSEGHEIANHSWSHPSLTSLDGRSLRQEVEKANDAIVRATGRRPKSMRPPYGAINKRVRRAILRDQGLDMVFWSCDPLDWERPEAEVVRQRMVECVEPGDILLAHDIHPGSVEAIPGIIQDLDDKGYEFATVSELLQGRRPRRFFSPVRRMAQKIASSRQVFASKVMGKE